MHNVVGSVGIVCLVTSAGLSANLPTQPTSPPSTLTTEATHPRTHHEVADLSGKWRMIIEMKVGRATPLLELTQKDAKVKEDGSLAGKAAFGELGEVTWKARSRKVERTRL